MIKKEGNIPLKMRKLKALLTRLHPAHVKLQAIKAEYQNRKSGYFGEQSLNYQLSFLKKGYLIFYDIRVPDEEGRYFQIDLLILTPRFHVIIEVKNHKGTLIFDQVSQQLIQEFNENRKGYSDPIIQARRQRIQLQSFLSLHKLPVAPIETLVVVSNPRTIIRIEPPNHSNSKLVLRAETIPFKIEELEQKYKRDLLTPKELQKLSRTLLKYDEPHQANILHQFKISESEILPGVHCPSCSELSMKRMKGYWYCNSCNYKSKTAHLSALEDYALLLNKKITNRDCRHFLQIDSVSVVTNILSSLQVEKTGSFKDREYHIEELIYRHN